MIFRLSQKLATKLHESGLPSLPLDENPYADWSAHLFTAERTQYVIVANTRSPFAMQDPNSSTRAHLSGRDDGLVRVAPLLAMIPDWRGLLNSAIPEEELRDL